MNLQKKTDYTDLFAAVQQAVEQDLSCMALYCEIGRLVSLCPEKGAAVAASKYLKLHYPHMTGFSPRNLRRMRDFYKLYAEDPSRQALTMKISWTQNVVLMESNLSSEQLDWYLKASVQYQWSKNELIQAIKAADYEKAHNSLSLEENTSAEMTSNTDCSSNIQTTLILNEDTSSTKRAKFLAAGLMQSSEIKPIARIASLLFKVRTVIPPVVCKNITLHNLAPPGTLYKYICNRKKIIFIIFKIKM